MENVYQETAPPLRRVSDLRAHIKVIVEVSRNMNMAATDAMLTIKQAGDYARRSALLSSQMDRLNRQLDLAMDEMLSRISQLVSEITAISEDDCALQYLEATREMSHANQIFRQLASRRKEDAARPQGSAQEEWIALSHELHHAYLMLQTALDLARRSQVESVCGKEMAAALKHAVGEIDATTQRVMVGIKQFNAIAEI